MTLKKTDKNMTNTQTATAVLLEEFIGKLDEIIYTKIGDYELSNDDWRVQIVFDFNADLKDSIPLIVSMNVYYQEVMAATFVCDSQQQICRLRNWFVAKCECLELRSKNAYDSL